MLNDLSDAVLDCSVPVTLKRFRATPVIDGRKQDPLFEECEVHASISPASGKDLQRLPEGQRLESTLLVFTPTKLHSVQTSECKIADRFTYQGVEYQVANVKDWSIPGGYYEALATRLER